MSSQCELFLISQELIPGKQFDSIVVCQMKWKKNITEFYLIFYVAVDNDLKWCECEWEKREEKKSTKVANGTRAIIRLSYNHTNKQIKIHPAVGNEMAKASERARVKV